MSGLQYGTVLIIDGPFKGRIGNYDDDHFINEYEFFNYKKSQIGDIAIDIIEDYDDETNEVIKGKDVAIVYFGELMFCQDYNYIPYEYLSPASTDDLLKRREELTNKLQGWGLTNSRKPNTYEMTELLFVESDLFYRLFNARYKENVVGKKVFVSHSSHDKEFVRKLCADLSNSGHKPWLDEWEIKVGDSIPTKIDHGIDNADYIIVVLSENALSSQWVEREWQSKYWDEIETNKIKVLPILYKQCKIPNLLKMKKYANFTNNYNSGLDDVLAVLNADL